MASLLRTFSGVRQFKQNCLKGKNPAGNLKVQSYCTAKALSITLSHQAIQGTKSVKVDRANDNEGRQ